ncbi:MAG: type VI secretion system contractile sheath small subunit [Gammaproteobacteria bacterium]
MQTEVPRARVNITLDVETNGAISKKELPCKILVLGDYSEGQSTKPVRQRKRLNLLRSNFDQVLGQLSPKLELNVKNVLSSKADDLFVKLEFKKIKDFQPDLLIHQIPELKKLLSMRNLLKDLKANLIDNHGFRKEIEKIFNQEDDIKQLSEELGNIKMGYDE